MWRRPIALVDRRTYGCWRGFALYSCCDDDLSNVHLVVTSQEVKKHRTPGDAWMVYRNKVYDVSGWHDVSV